RVPREDAVTEAGREALDLRLDACRHVHLAAVGNMAIGPGRLLVLWSPRRVEEALLRQQNEWSLRNDSMRHALLGVGDLLPRPAQVNRAWAGARRIAPGNRAVERVVHLEDPWPITVRLQPRAIPLWQRIPGDAQRLARRDVEEHRAGSW